MKYNPNLRQYNYERNLPQYAFGDWLKKNAGTIGTVGGMAAGLALAPMTGGMSIAAGGALGASLGGSIGGAVQSDYGEEQSALAQEANMETQRANSAYSNKVQLANNELQGGQGRQNQFGGTQSFRLGGPLKGLNYNQNLPQTSMEGDPYYITRRTTETQNNPNFAPFTDDYVAFQDSTLIPEHGNIRGYGINDGKISFEADHSGDTSKFKEAFSKKISIGDLGLPKKELGGSLQEYSGQSHEGPDGGIKVDAQGNPAQVTGEEPVGLVEDGENSWTDPETKQVYIFSDKLEMK